MRIAWALVAASLLPGCVLVGSSAVQCTEGRRRNDAGVCVPSPGALDGGESDGGERDGGGRCGGEVCGGERPRCHPDLDQCVGCVTADDCAPTQTCDPEQHRCVSCVSSSQCSDTTPICETGGCRRCHDDGECLTRSGEVCDEVTGRCAACTVDTESARCPGATCHPTELTCSGAAPNSVGFCGACVSDHECISSPTEGTLRCVPMEFAGEPHGSYCLLDLATYTAATGATSCPRPRFQPEGARSALGVDATYCFIRYGVTTCEAVNGLGADCNDAGDCGDPDLDDALCRNMLCTYPCVGNDECRSGTCVAVATAYCQ